jgi:hypothetical protein
MRPDRETVRNGRDDNFFANPDFLLRGSSVSSYALHHQARRRQNNLDVQQQ